MIQSDKDLILAKLVTARASLKLGSMLSNFRNLPREEAEYIFSQLTAGEIAVHTPERITENVANDFDKAMLFARIVNYRPSVMLRLWRQDANLVGEIVNKDLVELEYMSRNLELLNLLLIQIGEKYEISQPSNG